MKHITLENAALCSGCGVCAYVCPVNAISMVSDEEGYCIPSINETTCINCGKCSSTCHFQNAQERTTYHVIEQYAAKHIDESIRLRSRSGAAFVALSDVILDSGGVIYGAVTKSISEVIHTRAETKSERDEMCGSKYVQSCTADVYSKLEADVKSGRPILFSGAPCQISAVASLIGSKHENLFLCDFVCHGVPTPMLWKDYLDWVANKYHQSIVAVDFRDKRHHPWESHVEKISFAKRTIYSRRYTNIFCSNNCLRRSCYECPYTSMNRVSDFTLADYWGIDKVVPDFNDNKGVSLVLVRSKKASRIFELARNNMIVVDTIDSPPAHYNLYRPTRKPETRDAFWTDYHKHGFEYVSKKYGGYDILRIIKHKIIDKID